MTCPICKGEMRRLFTHRSQWILGCGACRHRAAEVAAPDGHVARVYDDGYFEGGGAGYTDYFSESAILVEHGRRYARLLSRYMRAGEMLDVGAAAGFLLEGFVSEGWRGEGVEPNARMAEHARTRLNLNVRAGSFEDFPAGRQYDLISMIQVVAHFVEPAVALRTASELTRAGGFLLIETWDRESLTARVLGKRWHEYSPPSVLQWFSRRGLSDFAAQFGFKEAAHGRPAKRIGGGHALSLLRYRLQGTPLEKMVAPLSRVVPAKLSIPYPAEDLFWTLFQKSGVAAIDGSVPS